MILAPSTDVQVELVIDFLLGCRGSSALFRQLALALFDKGGKFDCPIIRYFDARRGASNPHRRDRGIDLHVASLRYVAGDKGERSLG